MGLIQSSLTWWLFMKSRRVFRRSRVRLSHAFPFTDSLFHLVHPTFLPFHTLDQTIMSNFSWRPPSVPFEAQTRDGSPFTVWHVCIICQQPRSARYHSEHPIDANFAASPPQSICRRCASKSVSLHMHSAPYVLTTNTDLLRCHCN